MKKSPVINDSDDFTPMPTPDSVVHQGEADRLDPIPFQFSDIRALAARILKRAQEQAEQKLAAARNQIAAMEKQAYDKAYKEAFAKAEKDGFAKGEKDGNATAKAEIKKASDQERESYRQNAEPTLAVLAQLAQIMNDSRQQLIAQAEGDLLLLSLDIAKRLVGRELSVDAEAIRPIAIEAIGLVTDRTDIVARVNPEDLRIMEECIPDLKAIFPDLGVVRLEADKTVARGGIVAATREGEVDMRLATRLATFEEAILGFSGKDAEAPWNAVVPPEPHPAPATAPAPTSEQGHAPEPVAELKMPEPSATPTDDGHTEAGA